MGVLPLWMRIAVVAVCVAAAAAFVSPAYGWEMTKATNAVIVVRESQDTTAAAEIKIYYSYKGGDTWHADYNPLYSSSYNSVLTYPATFIQANVDAFEVPLVPGGGRVQLVSIAGSGGEFPVLYEPLNVAIVGTPAVSIDTTAPVLLNGAIEVTGTPEVAVASVDGLPVGFVRAGLLVGAIFSGAGFALWVGGRRGR